MTRDMQRGRPSCRLGVIKEQLLSPLTNAVDVDHTRQFSQTGTAEDDGYETLANGNTG